MQAKHDTADCGAMLLGFLHRFGTGFDYTDQAVSVSRGGVVPKCEVPAAAASMATGRLKWDGSAPADRLVTEDPLTGQ